MKKLTPFENRCVLANLAAAPFIYNERLRNECPSQMQSALEEIQELNRILKAKIKSIEELNRIKAK